MSVSGRIFKRVIIPIVVVCTVGYVVYAFTKPIGKVQSAPVHMADATAQTASLPWPDYGEAAVGAVGYGVLATNGTQTPLPTASTIKILTALAVLKQEPLGLDEQGPTITLTQADVDSYNKYVAEDGSVVIVQAGEQISEYQALQALLIPSANNMAETLARWAFGSIDAYNTYANQLAAQLGMTSTTVTDPSGFLPSTMSSAHDLTLLGETAMQSPVIRQIVAQPSATIPVQGVIYNSDQVLGQDGIVGIKTGNNDQDTGVFIFGATHEVSGRTITVVGAIMGAQDLGTAMDDSRPVVVAADQDFALTTAVHKGDVVGLYTTPWGQSVKAVAGKDLKLVTWHGQTAGASVTLKNLHAPAAAGQTVGTITAKSGLGNSSASAPAVLQQPLTKPSWIWRLAHVF